MKNQKKIVKWLGVVLVMLSALAGCGPGLVTVTNVKEAWNAPNSPALLGVNSKHYKTVQLAATIEDMAWSGFYWPTGKAGTSYRWQTKVSNYRTVDHAVGSLSRTALNRLSPAEKYDIWMGQYTFPLVRSERLMRATLTQNGGLQKWMGICHGWAAASLFHPIIGNQVTVQNPYGVQLEFYREDVEALISKYYADNLTATNVGERCETSNPGTRRNSRPADSKCRDINPAAFHLIVEDFLANKNRSIIADVSGNNQVWNHPLVSYAFSYSSLRKIKRVSRGPAGNWSPMAMYLVDVQMTIKYVSSEPASFTTVLTKLKELKLSYTLELDHRQYIIGGEWISTSHPDFLWLPQKKKPESEIHSAYLKLSYLLQLIEGLNARPI